MPISNKETYIVNTVFSAQIKQTRNTIKQLTMKENCSLHNKHQPVQQTERAVHKFAY